ncbi:AzlC family ABC transporter permease [Rhodovulum sulfidophilum]|uniref:AzlC family ABC transporter permease n=1 Tax=Rhodovulum sulfidophilum TaxID=35806 RepID=UPI0009525BF1|nr:AzlC family ABC transporter permease [Rhodovulum sulfidophilum]MBL3553702.1 AzlC family ABC transporter permease [Rhodovulum sulfidophilum]MCE8418310.1 AzlC family ABC transporter permease [Rhodovulum sulfidophilum]OLS48060.1 branched-chain amino acid transporter AzlC [Rhodovulum sulfidophilum]OLS52411.1 branched-chain amino acid transporter AzlC [Rhodovulum sulfidophilum]
MPASTRKSAYLTGLTQGTPFLLIIVPFALLFGVVATEAGLALPEVMGFSVVVVAGAAQFSAVQLMAENAHAAVIILTALAVNMRMAMYSASLTPYLGPAPLWQRALVAYSLFDQTYAVAHARYEARPEMGVTERIAFYAGAATPLLPTWYGMTLVGALVGRSIPPEFALDFALPITFLAMVAPALRTPAHVAAAGSSVALALVFAGLPYNLGLMIAAVAGMAVGAEIERRMGAR